MIRQSKWQSRHRWKRECASADDNANEHDDPANDIDPIPYFLLGRHGDHFIGLGKNKYRKNYQRQEEQARKRKMKDPKELLLARGDTIGCSWK